MRRPILSTSSVRRLCDLMCAARNRTGCAIGVCLSLLATTTLKAETTNSYPMLMSLKPVAVQIGQTTEAEVTARYNLYGATQVIVAGDDVTGSVVPVEVKPDAPPPTAKPVVQKLKLSFTVAANATPGPRDFRVVTPQGVSTVGQLVLTRDPVIIEAPDNNTAAKAQLITIPAAVCGGIEAFEDVDFFKFKVEAGTTLTFHVRSQRIQDRIHDLQVHIDPIMTLRTATGNTIATCDNYFAGDPFLFHQFEQAGEYLLELRDVRYHGYADWVYCIEINDRPFVTQVFPLATAEGTEFKPAAIGFNLPVDPVITFQIPPATQPGARIFAPLLAGQPTNAVGIVVTDLPIIPEVTTDNNELKDAQPFTAPASISGQIEKPSDVDSYVFEAKKDEKYSFEIIARRAGSELDSNLKIRSPEGGTYIDADDLIVGRVNQTDSIFDGFTIPADGKYVLQVRDLHLRGGTQYPYVLNVTRSQPLFVIEIDTDKTLLAPGISAPIYVRCVRKNGFAGEIQLAVEGLPAGVNATCGRILATGTDGCIILEAAANAPAGAANIKITGTAVHPLPEGELKLTATAQPMQELYFPGGGRGHYPVEMHTVSVAEPMDIRSLKLSTNQVTLKPGESQRVDVTIERAPGMKENLTLDILYQHLEVQIHGNSVPPGVKIDSAKSKTLLGPTDNQGYITLTAAADAAAVDKQLVPLMAHVSVNFVMKMTYASPLLITVDAPPKK